MNGLAPGRHSMCALLLLTLAGCTPNKSYTLPAPVMGYNHTSAGINHFSVDGAGGPNIGPFSGGGAQTCCGELPRQWRPGLKVLVKWEKDPLPYESRGWPEPIFSDAWSKRMEEHRSRYTYHQVIVEIPYYEKSCGIQTHFLPCDQVQVNTICMTPAHPDYPYKELFSIKVPKECPTP
ncbi:DUF3304 domain-containing protein [Aquipseudomonas campi]